MASFEDINYSLRPNKCVERKMLCESFRRLVHFHPLKNYRYVGFGSTYFSDFVLFHKELNLIHMLSIEREASMEARFELNCPYKCITIQYGESSMLLPAVKWNERPAIVWLDYDGPLNKDVLADVKTLVSNLVPASVFIVSVNAAPGVDNPTAREDRLIELIGKERVPMGFKRTDLAGWGTSKVFRTVIHNEIEEVLAERNGSSSTYEYSQLFNFNYADGAKMLTMGGILLENSDEMHDRFALCKFDDFPFFKSAEEAFKIDVPNLTWREIRALDKQLPNNTPTLTGVSASDIARYAAIYRYFPSFAEASF